MFLINYSGNLVICTDLYHLHDNFKKLLQNEKYQNHYIHIVHGSLGWSCTKEYQKPGYGKKKRCDWDYKNPFS